MASNIFGDRFLSKAPAWHGLGHVVGESEVDAVTALTQFMGDYQVVKTNLQSVPQPGLPTRYNLPMRAIMRLPTHDDDAVRLFGVVGSEYELITPHDICEIWDKSVSRPVETIGALGFGERLFITTKMPSFDVRGDQVDNFLLCESPMTGKEAAQVVVTPVKAVCSNTLRLAKEMSTETYRVRHDRNARMYLSKWLQGVYGKAVAKAGDMQQAFGQLAQVYPSAEQVKEVIEITYRIPAKPVHNTPDEGVMAQRTEAWAARVRMITNYREYALGLFNGGATGIDSIAMSGTLFGLYNSVTELENYRKANGQEESAAVSVMFGQRGLTMERAFDACWSIAKGA
jgi:Domain of unknown function (DUF932)